MASSRRNILRSGCGRRSRVAGYVAYFFAAASQIVLCTVLRAWILDVPMEFTRTPEEIEYLDSLVVFQLVTIVVVVLAIWLRRTSEPKRSG